MKKKKKKKLSLNQLKVTSFVTSINDQYIKTIIGGVGTKNPDPLATNDLQPCAYTDLAQHCGAMTAGSNPSLSESETEDSSDVCTTKCFSNESDEIGLCPP